MNRQKRLLGIVAAVVFLLPAIAGAVTVTADFTHGNDDTTYVDAYKGIAGEGWFTPWQESQSDVTGVATVMTSESLSFDELSSGTGNYLDAAASFTSAGGGFSVGRDYAGLNCLDPSADQTVSFLFRVDEDNWGLTAAFTGLSDRYQIYDDPTIRNGASSTTRWCIGAYGAGDGLPGGATGSGVNPADAGYWLFYDGLGDGACDPNRQVNTGIAIQSGHTLSFQVTVHAATKKWDATITDLETTQSFSQSNMGWRVNLADNPAMSGLVQFCGRADSADGSDQRHFSLDAVHATGSAYVPPAWTRVVARFNDGNSTSEVDAYRGIAGGGWATAWLPKTSSATLAAAVVASGETGFDELATGTGNYLDVSGTVSKAAGGFAVGRNYTGAEGIEPLMDHTVKFLFRVDESAAELASTFTGLSDRYQMYDDPTSRVGAVSSSRWIIGAYGAGDDLAISEGGSGVGADDAGYWLFYDGLGDGDCDPDRQVNTGIALVSGHTLSFELTIHADTNKWDATMTDLDTAQSFSKSNMGWRVTGDPAVSGLVQFCGRVDSASGDLRQFSVDEIVITQGTLPAIPGDTNNDSKVDATDAAKLATNWGKSNVAGGSGDGDFNNDGYVNAADAAILAANWTGSAEGAVVPEPAALVLLGIGVVTLSIGRRRRPTPHCVSSR